MLSTASNTSLRSLMIGDCDHYRSPYMYGVAQGMQRLGHNHQQISIRKAISEIRKIVVTFKPQIIWTHMLLWPPKGSPSVGELIMVMAEAKKLGAKIIIHDGDYKEATRYPHDISAWCSLALCNHSFGRSAWKVPFLRWPYFAFSQDQIAAPDPKFVCDMFFAGLLLGGRTYSDRTELIEKVKELGVAIRMPTPQEGNTLFRTAEIAPAALTVLGFGRPDIPGWVDTRLFQYGGAGGILLHDDAKEFLEPLKHYIPYKSKDPQSVVSALRRVKNMKPEARQTMRENVFKFIQEKHSSVPRVQQALDAVMK